MASARSAAAAHLADPRDFSVVLGGPLFQLFRRAHLAGNGLELLRQRVLAITALSWLPLLILTVWQGLALGTKVPVPFLRDIEAQARFLLFVPLLIGAELIVHQRLGLVASQFLKRGLVPEDARPRFDAAVATTIRLRNSVVAELAMIALVYVVGLQLVWRQHSALDVATWYATPTAEGWRFSLAGRWYVYFALPLAQFLLLRWYYRLFIWARFLWQVSRIDLRLVATHPDRIGGLGFLAVATAAFAPLAVAHGAFLSGWIASRIFLNHAALLDFKVVIIAVAVWMLLLFLGPFLVFSPQLARARRQGERDYGPLAGRYTLEFDAKWVNTNTPPTEPLLGSADIQSLADMGNVYAVVKTMRTTPITRQAVIQLLASTLAPIAPLALTMMPLGEIVKLLFGILT
ncbi:MAG TPA: hypothetical protein VGU74_09955 [Gemmatimonadales bacterium]|nr:hypothetical protein [Gemmatimonadales bacterium]